MAEWRDTDGRRRDMKEVDPRLRGDMENGFLVVAGWVELGD
ncbi:MAG: hypothetical protein ACYTEQ_22045 [Planctomycetota bacterium]